MGLYETIVPSLVLRSCHRRPWKAGPLSELTLPGFPKCLTHPCMKAEQTPAEVAPGMGIASKNLVVLQTIVSIYLCPSREGVSGPLNVEHDV